MGIFSSFYEPIKVAHLKFHHGSVIEAAEISASNTPSRGALSQRSCESDLHLLWKNRSEQARDKLCSLTKLSTLIKLSGPLEHN